MAASQNSNAAAVTPVPSIVRKYREILSFEFFPFTRVIIKARTSRLFSLFFGILDKKLKVLDCAIKTTKMCSFRVFEGEGRSVSTPT